MGSKEVCVSDIYTGPFSGREFVSAVIGAVSELNEEADITDYSEYRFHACTDGEEIWVGLDVSVGEDARC